MVHMLGKHPHADATYTIVPQDDGAYGVSVAIPDQQPTLVTGLATLTDAEEWIAGHRQRVAEAPLKRLRPFRRRT